jgi:hypothetical protein
VMSPMTASTLGASRDAAGRYCIPPYLAAMASYWVGMARVGRGLGVPLMAVMEENIVEYSKILDILGIIYQ